MMMAAPVRQWLTLSVPLLLFLMPTALLVACSAPPHGEDHSHPLDGSPAMSYKYVRHPTFPPAALIQASDRAPLAAWYRANAYVPLQTAFSGNNGTGSGTASAAAPLPARTKQLLRWTATEFVAARRGGEVTCEEYARVLVDRMLFLRDTQQFMQTSYALAEKVVDAARAMDRQAASAGVQVLAPLYCLPVPMKGTMATTDFPSSAGNALLDNVYARRDAAFVTLFRQANAIVMGKTNVPDFAASWVTMNPINGRTMNLYDGSLTSGGSSGGAASAVAGHVAPLAVTEDTGG